MAETINLGWLKNNNGEKFAPKTLTSQVQTSDGTLIEDKIQADINTLRDEAKLYTDSVTSGKADSTHNHDEYLSELDIESLELITVDDIDTICGTSIQIATASEVTF